MSIAAPFPVLSVMPEAPDVVPLKLCQWLPLSIGTASSNSLYVSVVDADVTPDNGVAPYG